MDEVGRCSSSNDDCDIISEVKKALQLQSHDDDIHINYANITSFVNKALRHQSLGPVTEKGCGHYNLLVRIMSHDKNLTPDEVALLMCLRALTLSVSNLNLFRHESLLCTFVMFYACSLDPEYCGVKFATFLADIFIRSKINDERKNAVTYLASYLSRAKFLSLPFIVDMLKRVVDWCLEYCESLDRNSNLYTDDVFYHGCQAILYVLCFHMRPILDVPHLKQLIIMPLEEIHRHRHKLNPHPLNMCLPYVVKEFLRQAKAARLFAESDMSSLDEIVSESMSSKLETIDPCFFPFDPCLSKDLQSLIHEKYVYQPIDRN